MKVKYISSVVFGEKKKQEKGYDAQGCMDGLFPSEIDGGDSYEVQEQEVELVGEISDGKVGFEKESHHTERDDWWTYYLWVPGQKEVDKGFYKRLKIGETFEYGRTDYYKKIAILYVMLDGKVPLDRLKKLGPQLRLLEETAVAAATQPLEQKILEVEKQLESLKQEVRRVILTPQELALLRKIGLGD